MSLAAVDAEDRAGQLIALTRRLTDRLASETLMFERQRPQDAAPGMAETQKLANLYRHECARIAADPSLIAGADPNTRRRLIEVTRAFEAVLARHGRVVAAAKTVSEGLVRAIAEEIARTRTAAAGYGSGGRSALADAGAIALNRRA
jgi:hypothetical protein